VSFNGRSLYDLSRRYGKGLTSLLVAALTGLIQKNQPGAIQ